MEKTFFQELSAIVLQDKQTIRINITKVGEDLTALIVHEGKHINMSGTASEFDTEFLNQIKSIPVHEKKFTAEVTDAPESENEEEDDNETPDKKAVKVSDKKKTVAKSENKKAVVATKPKVVKPEEIALEVPICGTENKSSTDSELENKKTVFKHSMAEGKKFFEERKYKESEEAYKQASNLFPDDVNAKTEYEKAAKWVKAVSEL